MTSRQDLSLSSTAALDPPIFVVGYMHSGTTLLLNILSTHPAVFSCKGESKWFELLPIVRSEFSSLENEQTLLACIAFAGNVIKNGWASTVHARTNTGTEFLEQVPLSKVISRAREERDHGTIFRIVANFLTRQAGKERWLEKTPTHIYHIDSIVRAVPDALFVEIIRDPRDILASKKTRRQTVWTKRYRLEQRSRKHLEKAFDPLWDSLAWKSAIYAGEKARTKYPQSCYTARYEDLVSQPAEVVQRICAFLDLPYDSRMLEIETRNSADWEKSSDTTNGITVHSVGRWQDVLSLSEVALCQQVTNQEMRTYRYKLASIPPKARLGILVLVLRSLVKFWIRIYRKWRLGGTGFVKAVFWNYRERLCKLLGS